MVMNDLVQNRSVSTGYFFTPLLLFTILFLIAGCTTLDDSQVLLPEIITDDDLLLSVNTELPEFGGIYYDEKGQLNVYITGLDSISKKTEQDRIKMEKRKSPLNIY